ncbi:MAG: methylmalonyl-CoA mutase [Peptococcaceae bacterium BRH_c4b]|nr:MAG: methylmalonyl-CoA mutase [Peptococcaceae bacterium BRH_c4b]
MNEKSKIRVLLAKPGLDAHDNGVKTVAFALRDAGMEVIYLGMRQTPENIVRSAFQEDVDIIGLSCHGAAIVPLGERVMKLLREKNADIPVIYGGTILNEDRDKLLSMGIKETFSPGASFSQIINSIVKLVAENQNKN